MEQVTELEAQGTQLRVVSPVAVVATFGQAAMVVTVTKTAHGLADEDRISVATAVGSVGAVGRFSVTVIDANSFRFTADITATVPAGAALTYHNMYALDPKTIQGPGGAASVIDATTLSSKAKQKRMGLPDEGQVQFDIFYVPKHLGYEILRDARRDRVKLPFEMAFTDTPTTYWSWDAFVLQFPVNASVDALVATSVTTEITGEITEY